MGRVVNITKFGAFVNILPGRDGLVHISKLGRGKRINAVEDVLALGQEIEVARRGDRRQGQGQPEPRPADDARRSASRRRSGRRRRGAGGAAAATAPTSSGSADVVETVSFEDAFDAELAGELGDLGPAGERAATTVPAVGGDRGGRDRGRGRGGRDRALHAGTADRSTAVRPSSPSADRRPR